MFYQNHKLMTKDRKFIKKQNYMQNGIKNKWEDIE